MVSLCEARNLGDKRVCEGLVFAMNCRIAGRDPVRVAELLERVPGSQALLWTGTGEPTIPASYVEELEAFFQERGVGARVGFDVKVAEGVLQAAVSETMMVIINVWHWGWGVGRG